MKIYIQFLLSSLLAMGMLLLSTNAIKASDQLQVVGLTTEHFENPLGIDQVEPRFSWILKTQVPATMQKTWHIQVSRDKSFNTVASLMWNSGIVENDQSVLVEYRGKPLQSTTRYYWRVSIADNHGNNSGWSETAWFETGLLNPGDWKARWIQVPWNEDKTTSPPSPMLRSEFAINRQIASARIYASAMGLYEIEINGQKVGDQLFTPGWTSFSNRVQYQTYDITDMLRRGNNAIGVVLGDGWYRGFLGWKNQRNFYGETLAFIAQIQIVYTNGTTQTIITDQNWRASTGPILYSDIYNGEKYDARLEKNSWSVPGYNARDWQRVRLTSFANVKLIAPQAPPVKAIQELKPMSVFITPQGDTVIDFGQNLVGHMRIRTRGTAGKAITIRHAEIIDKHGNFYTENLRSASQTNTYILKGQGIETWEPKFTFQGFRYVAINGFPGDIYNPEAFTAIVVHSDMIPTGHFDCSNPLVNRLQHNIVWGQKGNFLDVPTDCPQRDERMGWTGDIQVFANTANLNMNTASFLTRWLADLEADQFPNGSVTFVVPNVLGPGEGGAAGWGDAATVVPWSIYQSFGDKRILERQYNSMKAWVNYMKERASLQGDPYLWIGDFHFGDWLSFASLNQRNYPGAHTHPDLIATAYFARSTGLMAQIARILNKTEDAEFYQQLLENITRSFQKEFVTPNGRLSSDTQTAYLLALRYNLLPDNLRTSAARYLAKDLRERGHLTTGFLGTPHLNHALSEFGFHEDAYKLLLRTQYPSWLYPVTMGATTIWERWDGIKTDSTFQSKSMNSFNHYAYGAVGDWLFKEAAGIKNSSPGYKSFTIQPVPGGGMHFARALLYTPYGKVLSSWKFDNGKFDLTIEIPANTNARVKLPWADARLLTINGQVISRTHFPFSFKIEYDGVWVDLGSGTYKFSYPAGKFPAWAIPTESNLLAAGFNPGRKTLLAELLALKQTREILMEEIPQLLNSPWLSQVMGYPLEHITIALPRHVRISIEELQKIENRLQNLNK